MLRIRTKTIQLPMAGLRSVAVEHLNDHYIRHDETFLQLHWVPLEFSLSSLAASPDFGKHLLH